MKALNVFLKSAVRQPAKMGILAALILVAAFALVARVTEFIIISEEIERIEGVYSAVGILAPIAPVDITDSHDVSRAAGLIGASLLVAFEDERVFAQGVMHGITNVTAQMVGVIPRLHGLEIDTMEFYFYGHIAGGICYFLLRPRRRSFFALDCGVLLMA